MVTGGYERSAALLLRAQEVIPNGVFGHRRTFAFTPTSSRTLPDTYPHFVDRAQGCRMWDVDGNEYVDWLCGYGPMIAGYADPAVEAAAAAERARGDCYDFPSEVSVARAERLVGQQAAAAGGSWGRGWAAFALNGTDAVTMAMVVARAATDRSVIVMADGAFHGNLWFARAGPGWDPADGARTRTVPWGDTAALAAVLAAEPVAAVLLCPYEQLVGAENRLPPAGWWATVRDLCTEHAAALVVDDIRSGFRVDPAGTCAHFSIEPDLVVLSKALANGYPVSAVVGAGWLREAAAEVFISGTFWGQASGLAAALATLDRLACPGAYQHLASTGRRLTDGLVAVGADHGIEVLVSGPPALPHVRIADDPRHELACALATELAAEGTLVHPTHNWFVSLAHTAADVDLTLEHAAAAMARVAASR